MAENRKARHFKIAAVTVVALLAVSVGLAYYLGRAAGGPMFEVVQGIGNLEPFTSPLPRGSSVILGADTVASLVDLVDVRPSEAATRRIRMYRGQWRPTTSASVRTDSSMVGVLLAPQADEQPVIVRLQSGPPANAVPVGDLILKPGEKPLQVYQ